MQREDLCTLSWCWWASHPTLNKQFELRPQDCQLSKFSQFKEKKSAVQSVQCKDHCLMITDKVPHDISDFISNIFRNTWVDKFNSTFTIIIEISRRILKSCYVLQNYCHWNENSNVQDSSFVVNTTCWDSGGMCHKASDCPSNKVAKTPTPIPIPIPTKTSQLWWNWHQTIVWETFQVWHYLQTWQETINDAPGKLCWLLFMCWTFSLFWPPIV